jgi:predicted anti-sigma-YlaC factor YlaD
VPDTSDHAATPGAPDTLDCARVQGALSTRAAGEAVEIPVALLHQHIELCEDCRDFADEIADIQRHFSA